MEEFLKWNHEMVKGINFISSVAPITEDCAAPLFKVKSFLPVWSELVRRARPSSQCVDIRLNLDYNSSMRKRSKLRRTEKQIQDSTLRSNIGEAKAKVDHEATKLKSLVIEEEKLIQEEQKLLRQLHLMNTATECRENKILHLKQWSTSLSHLLPEYPKAASPQDESIKQEAANNELLNALSHLKNFKKLQQKDSLENNEYSCLDKTQVWKCACTLAERYPPTVVMNALSCVTGKEVQSLLNACKTEENFKNTCFDEMKHKNFKKETVRSLLLQLNGNHQKKFFSNAKRQKEIRVAKDSLKDIVNNINSIAQNLHKDFNLVSELTQLQNVTLKVAGLRASLSAASSLHKNIDDRCIATTKAKNALLQTHSEVMHFDESVRTAVQDIEDLVVSVYEISDAIKKEGLVMQSSAEDGVDSSSSLHPALKSSLMQEIEAVADLPSALLGTKIPKCFDIVSLDGREGMLPYITSIEHLVELIRQRTFRRSLNENNLEEESECLRQMTHSLNNEVCSIYHIKELKQKVHNYDQNLEKEIVLLLGNCEQTIRSAEKKCSILVQRVAEWWSQPGIEISNYLKAKKCMEQAPTS